MVQADLEQKLQGIEQGIEDKQTELKNVIAEITDLTN